MGDVTGLVQGMGKPPAVREALAKEGVDVPDGAPPVRIRAATMDDLDGLRTMLSRLSRETIYQRFHMPYPRVPDWMPALLLGANRPGARSFVAVIGDEVVAHAMYAAPEQGESEAAVVVEDAWQALGIGTLLLRELADSARSRGVDALLFASFIENRRVPRLVRSVFAEASYEIRDGLRMVRTPLRPD
jgi:GNAT superfamily N-acetyltransferase